MDKPADTIETTEIEAIAFSPEEIMTTDELPMKDLVIVEEPPMAKKDYSESQDLGDFMEWITGKMNSLPPHSGKTTAGCERVIAHLKMLDKEISKAISRDVDCQLDDQAVEKFRKDIRKMIKKLDKRHKEINEAYDADDEKFASAEINIKTSSHPNDFWFTNDPSGDDLGGFESKDLSAVKDWAQKKADETGKNVIIWWSNGREQEPETIVRPKLSDDGLEANDRHILPGELSKIDVGEGKAKEPVEHKADDAPLYCKLCGGKFPNKRAAKAHADVNHPGESVTFSDMPPAPKTASDCACHVEKTADDNCPTCNIKLWKAAEGLYECVSCEATFERPLTKEAGTAKLTLVMTPFERAITGTIVNSFVSQGKNPEETYVSLKKKYKFTDRDELSIQQVLADMGYPMLKDRGHLGDESEKLNKGEGVEFSTQYNA